MRFPGFVPSSHQPGAIARRLCPSLVRRLAPPHPNHGAATAATATTAAAARISSSGPARINVAQAAWVPTSPLFLSDPVFAQRLRKP